MEKTPGREPKLSFKPLSSGLGFHPFSDGMPSFRGPDLRETDMWGVTPIDQMICRIKFKQARYDGPLTPVGLQYAVVFPWRKLFCLKGKALADRNWDAPRRFHSET